ncbi:MAG: energy transducer TonB [Bacteroidales bacterium]
MSNPKKQRKDFLKLPTYPGGKKAFNTFIQENLKYPEEALKHNIEGDVLVTYEVTDNGEVLNASLKHGIGYGCDEEALRLISELKFGKTTNRGMRVRSRFTTRIPFRIKKKPVKQTTIAYHQPEKKAATQQPATVPKPKSGNTITWQININKGTE